MIYVFFLSLLNCIIFLVTGVLETLNIWTYLWDQSGTKVCTSKIWTLRLACILWNSSKLNSTPLHGKVCKPGSFLPFLPEKIAWGLQTPSASAQTQHSLCLPLRSQTQNQGFREVRSAGGYGETISSAVWWLGHRLEVAFTSPCLRGSRPNLPGQTAQLAALPLASWESSLFLWCS